MEYLLVGVAVSFNIIIILWKFGHSRTTDAVLDSAILIGVTMVFSSSYGALVVGTVASFIVSLYLLMNPPAITTRITSDTRLS